ncbi:hypothetical protein QUF49_12175 [Fictibacillus sp. b24]|uniref:hypothetical protein n=1 Tax=Fictibacillus sp. b24 TaxID=3055863 RepID=UPI0025A039DB|nr:hypothetical protein [Fictibacillus sp. b24]MDM5316755.1 hypothetical protein [Fictibacillus sp. b24]
MRDSCGTSGQVRSLKAHSGKGLTACPAEMEHLKRKSTTSLISFRATKFVITALIFVKNEHAKNIKKRELKDL